MKGVAFVMALLFMGLPALADGCCAVSTEAFSALVDPDGTIILGDVETIFEVRPNALYAAGVYGEYRLYDANGNRLSDVTFSMIDDMGDTLVFRQGGLCGAMDDEGQVIVPAEWTQLVPNGEGAFLALSGDLLDDQPDEVFVLHPGEEALATSGETASGLRALSDGRMPCAGADGMWGCLDARGRQILPAKWKHVGDFTRGLALASDENGRGAIDADGNVVIPMRYAWMARQEDIAALDDSGQLDVYGPDAALRFTVEGPVLDAGIVGAYVYARTAEGTYLYSDKGECLYAAGPAARFYPGEGGQVILADGAWGEACWRLVNADGSIVEARFQRLVPLCAGRYAFMALPGVQYRGDEITGTQTSWDYDNLRWGLVDGEGQVLLPAEYSEIRAAGDRLLLFREGNILLADRNGVPIATLFTAEPR